LRLLYCLNILLNERPIEKTWKSKGDIFHRE
jgi:hypothetical protein